MKHTAKALKKSFRRIKREYVKTERSGVNNSLGEWLTDNFYLIRQEYQNALNAFKFSENLLIDAQSEKKISLCCEKIIGSDGVTASLTEIENAVRELNLSCSEIDLLPPFLRFHITAFISHSVKAGDAKGLSSAIGSLRGLYMLDFDEILKKCCKLEIILSSDGGYENMSEKTKSLYRNALLRQAKRQGICPESLAAAAREQAEKTGIHIGRFIDFRDKLQKRGTALLILQGVIPFIAVCTAAAVYQNPYAAALLFFPLWEALRPLTEKIMLRGIKPRVLPSMELNSRIPENARTLVVISTLLPDKNESGQIMEKLVGLKQSNGGENIGFLVLADLKSAKSAQTESDLENIKAAEREIQRLNAEYSGGFALAVRERQFSKTQREYTGEDRKIGAIIRLVRKIKGESVSFVSFCGDVENIEKTKYIMALDWDSDMPLDTLPDLVAAAVHPLNKPVIKNGRVADGYGIISPSVGVSLESSEKTAFSNIMSGGGGITAYDAGLCNFYFDLFGEGIFSGKGLIDVDAYYKVVVNALPSEKILSHDSVESGLLRTGFLSCAQLLDEFPENEGGYLGRLHRWTRGDWQNIIYLFGRVAKKENPLNLLTKYKLFDNLRRSLTPVFSVLLLIYAAFTPSSLSLLMLFTAILSVCSGYALSIICSLAGGIKAMLSKNYYSNVKTDIEKNIKSLAANVITLPQTAFICADAILKALWRTLFSKKKLLEWTTFAQSEKKPAFRKILSRQLPGIVLSAFLLFSQNPFVFIAGLAFLSNPLFDLLSGRERKDKNTKIKSEKQKEYFRRLARAQWRYYEQYCNEDTSWLPPDNVQETPRFDIAYRTSPTNIGMYMLCVLAARDFGFITSDETAKRLGGAIESISRLKKWHGNLLNWYDIKTLETLEPQYVSSVDSGNFICALTALKQGLKEYSHENRQIALIIRQLEEILANTDLRPLYNEKRKLFYIGRNLSSEKPDECYYDLLMSEARMTGYYAVASRQVSKKHWGSLGRSMTKLGGKAGLVSWSGTMFEYYMPHILLPVYKSSLIYESLKFCLYCQKKRTQKAKIPWGISESAFYCFDAKLNYLYKAHGVQRLGLKRGLNSEAVVSPYSSFLALPHFPKSSIENLEKLEKLGTVGECGFYEAADFTKGRASFGSFAIVKSYMAHHIGMSLLSLSNAAFDNIMQKRFINDPKMSAAKTLLQEKAVGGRAIYKVFESTPKPKIAERKTPMTTHTDEINITRPFMRLFTNGEWSVAVCDNGASTSLYNGLNITKRSGDLLLRPQGVFAALETESFVMPLAKCLDSDFQTEFAADFEENRAVLYAQRDNLKCETSVCVAQNSPCEIRGFKLKNTGNEPLKCRLIICFEPSLDENSREQSHPAFSHLFLQPSFNEEMKAAIFKRPGFKGGSKAALVAAFDEDIGFDYSFSCAEILKRPQGVKSLTRGNIPFNQNITVGDCCFAAAVPLRLEAGEERTLKLLLCAALTSNEALLRTENARKELLQNKLSFVSAAFAENTADFAKANELLPHIFYSPFKSREGTAAARLNERNIDALWSLGISGDNPVVFAEISSARDIPRIMPYINAGKTLRLCSVKTDTVLLCGKNNKEEILSELERLMGQTDFSNFVGGEGGIRILAREACDEKALTALIAFSSYIVPKTDGRITMPPIKYEPLKIMPVQKADGTPDGFETEGGVFRFDEFVITKEPERPWCNIICNRQFGTLVSDAALGCTWAFNSRENKLTPWYNDVKTDNTGEMLLLKIDGKIYDAVLGSMACFSPNKAVYKGKIGAVETRVEVTVGEKALSKHIRLNLKNNSDFCIPVEAAYYTEPVLGSRKSRPHLIKAETADDGSLVMTSPLSGSPGGFMGLTIKEKPDFYVCDKKDFFGGKWISAELLPLPDGCACVGKRIKLPAKREESVEFVLSYAKSKNACLKMPYIKDKPERKNSLRVTTPDKEMNYLINTWLPVQIINSRLFGRTGFYQCGGAYGFRDQLQDVSALFLLAPDVAKAHIIRSCQSQFEQGDVLHWWHVLPSDKERIKGVRTRYSDDMLWLPFVVSQYVEATGDTALLDIKTAFVEGEELKDGEDERYFVPGKTQLRQSVYEHCLKAIERSLDFGSHGLPLIKGGDWCDGFNGVGKNGRGESVWLGEFMVIVLSSFSKICDIKGDTANKEKCERTAWELKENIEKNAWDGEWFLRAYYDDGSKMGSKNSRCCEIDLMAQSFAGLCSMPPDKTDCALNAAIQRLVDENAGIIKLFSPPFSEDEKSAGYINAYPPGVRENGGQYTHAAVWFCLALIRADRADEAYKYLRMINPINKYSDCKKAAKYAAEPYALTGDVYSNESDTGKGGWSHYTGSAAWYYKCVTEDLLGIRRKGAALEISPCLPREWLGYTATLEFDGGVIDIEVKSGSERLLLVDSQRAESIPLDGKNHKAVLII